MSLTDADALAFLQQMEYTFCGLELTQIEQQEKILAFVLKVQIFKYLSTFSKRCLPFAK
jgi:hypothetical protein